MKPRPKYVELIWSLAKGAVCISKIKFDLIMFQGFITDLFYIQNLNVLYMFLRLLKFLSQSQWFQAILYSLNFIYSSTVRKNNDLYSSVNVYLNVNESTTLSKQFREKLICSNNAVRTSQSFSFPFHFSQEQHRKWKEIIWIYQPLSLHLYLMSWMTIT